MPHFSIFHFFDFFWGKTTELSDKPEPINGEWHKTILDLGGKKITGVGTIREIFEGYSSLHLHCDKPMIVIRTIEKIDGREKTLPCRAWVCQICQRRESSYIDPVEHLL